MLYQSSVCSCFPLSDAEAQRSNLSPTQKHHFAASKCAPLQSSETFGWRCTQRENDVDLSRAVCRYLRDTLHFIDKRRVAVWGWSYGGFVAALALASPKSVFQCAVAVAPVTNWKLYGKKSCGFLRAVLPTRSKCFLLTCPLLVRCAHLIT